MPHPRPRPYLFPLLPHTRPTPHPPPPKADLAVPSPFSPQKTPAAVRPSLAHKPRNKSVHRPQDVATNRRNVRNISTPSSTCSSQCPLLSSLLLKPGSPSRTWAVVTLLPLPTPAADAKSPAVDCHSRSGNRTQGSFFLRRPACAI